MTPLADMTTDTVAAETIADTAAGTAAGTAEMADMADMVAADSIADTLTVDNFSLDTTADTTADTAADTAAAVDRVAAVAADMDNWVDSDLYQVRAMGSRSLGCTASVSGIRFVLELRLVWPVFGKRSFRPWC